MKSEKATYIGFEFEVEGFPAIAIINTDLKNVEEQTKYTYSVFIEIMPDQFNEMGHPLEEEHDYLVSIEKEMIAYLESQTQTVHVGHTTVYNLTIFFILSKHPFTSFSISSFLNRTTFNSKPLRK